MESGHPPFTGGKKLDDFVKGTMGHVKGCQKMAMELQGWQHFRDYPGVQRCMDQVNSSISTIIGSIFKHQDIKLDLAHHRLSDKLEMIREGNDALLERINSDIDEASGVKKNQDAEQLLAPIIKRVQAPPTTGGKNIILLAARNVQKPQLFFEEKVNNSAKEPFIPLIKEKPNSLKPLCIILCLDPSGHEYFSHPYEYELNHWNPAAIQLQSTVPVLPVDMGDTPLLRIDTHHDLVNMVQELKTCTEIAVDLEHHAYRSYLGLTCLMQISTRTTDYIVDTIALRGRLTILNEVFTNPKITKVLHGTDYDVLWLQRDCGVYLVNLFDTHQAAIVLEYPHRSLAALLLRFCNIQANKVFQRADWRIRPLPEEFIDYARQDTHFLLYIYDQLRNELVEKGNQLNNLISSVYDRSKDLCLKRYNKPVVGHESHLNLYRHSRKAFNPKQMFALRELYLWRDKIGREQDESPEYVLPKHMLLQICEHLPKEMQGILACCNPIPPLVKIELLTLHTILREAREQAVIEIKHLNVDVVKYPNAMDDLAADMSQNLTCKHDFSHCEDNATELPTLLSPKTKLVNNPPEAEMINVVVTSSSHLFGGSSQQDELKRGSDVDISRVFTSPYERYTAYLELGPLLEEEKDKKKKGVGVQDQERVDRIKEHFLTLTNNTPSEFKEDMKVATNYAFSGLTKVVTEGSLLEFEGRPSSQHHHQQTDVEVDDEGNPIKKKKKRKVNPAKKEPLILQEKIKEDKAQRSGKRKSAGEDNGDVSPNKVQKGEADVEMAEGDGVEGGEDEEDVEVGSSDVKEDSPQQGFNYDDADFSIFLKAQRKLSDSRQKVKENFKGKNQKGTRGKSSMKSFTWGNVSGNKGHR